MAFQQLVADFGIKFPKAWESQLQQNNSKLAGAYAVDGEFSDGVTERWVKDIAQAPSFTENNGRFGKQNAAETSSEDRRLSLRQFENFMKFDRNDGKRLADAHLPQSEVMQELKYAWNRMQDDIILDALTAPVYVSPREAPVQTALPASQVVAVNYVHTGSAANSGLTPWKIRRGLTLLKKAEVDTVAERPVLVITPEMEQAMLAYVAASPNDTWATMIGKYEMDPKNGLLGCDVIVSNRLRYLDGSTTIRDAVLFTRRAVLGTNTSFEFMVDTLATERHAIQVSAYAKFSAIRRWDKRVVVLRVDEAA